MAIPSFGGGKPGIAKPQKARFPQRALKSCQRQPDYYNSSERDSSLTCTLEFKQIIVPFIVYGILYAIPLDSNFKITFVILSGAPIAVVVQNFTEMINQGQENAADMVILGTVLSVITIPLITLVL